MAPPLAVITSRGSRSVNFVDAWVWSTTTPPSYSSDCRCRRSGSSRSTCRTPRRRQAAPAGARAPRAMCGSSPSQVVIGAARRAAWITRQTDSSACARSAIRSAGVLAADRQPQQAGRDAGRLRARPPSAGGGWSRRGARCPSTMPPSDVERSISARAVHDPLAAGAAAGHLERQHAAEAAVEQPGREARAADADGRPGYGTATTSARLCQPGRDRERVRALALIRSASVRIPRRSSQAVSGSATPPVSIRKARTRARSSAVPQTAPASTSWWPFRNFVAEWQHDVRAVLERPAEERCGERGVDDEPRARRVRELAERVEVGDRRARVRDRLAVEGVDAALAGRPHGVEIGDVDDAHVDAEARAEELAEQRDRVAVGLQRDHQRGRRSARG